MYIRFEGRPICEVGPKLENWAISGPNTRLDGFGPRSWVHLDQGYNSHFTLRRIVWILTKCYLVMIAKESQEQSIEIPYREIQQPAL